MDLEALARSGHDDNSDKHQGLSVTMSAFIVDNSLKSITGWCLAGLLSILLNGVMFGLMPGLIQQVPEKIEPVDSGIPVTIIRVRRPDTPVARQQEKKPEEMKKTPEPEKIAISARPAQTKPKPFKPRLAFQLNPKLPLGPSSLAMPSLETFSIEAPVLKSHYSMTELDTPLTPLVKIPPIYPMKAMRRGIQGAVTVRFLVNARGLVEEPEIVESNPKDLFEAAVISCVSQWKFKPGTIDGMAVATLVQTTIRFRLED